MKGLASIPFQLAFFFALVADEPAEACTVCFGDPHSEMVRGAMLAVLFLLGVVTFVLACIAWVAAVWIRRARKMGAALEGEERPTSA